MGPSPRRGTSESSTCFQTSSAFGFLVFMFEIQSVGLDKSCQMTNWEKRKRHSTEVTEKKRRETKKRRQDAGAATGEHVASCSLNIEEHRLKSVLPKQKRPDGNRGALLFVNNSTTVVTCLSRKIVNILQVVNLQYVTTDERDTAHRSPCPKKFLLRRKWLSFQRLETNLHDAAFKS